MLHDRDIREPLFFFLEERYGRCRILEEKQIGKSRADLLMVTENSITGIEIKSDADSYQRLEGQVRNYDLFCDFNICVVGTRHALHIEEHLPEHWGIITVEETEEEADFYFLRKPRRNPSRKLSGKLSLLWRPELSQLLEKFALPRYERKSKNFVREKLLENIPEAALEYEISETLLERDEQKTLKEIEAYRLSAARDEAERKKAIRRSKGGIRGKRSSASRKALKSMLKVTRLVKRRKQKS